MTTIPIEAANGRLDDIVDNLPPGGEITLTRNQQPVAVLRGLAPNGQNVPRLGTLAGTVLSISPDFDDIPEGFEDYLS